MNKLACNSAASGGIRSNKEMAGSAVRENSFAGSGLRDSTRGRRRRRVQVARLQLHDSGFRMFRVF